MSLRVLVTGRGSIARRHVQHLRALVPGVVVAVVAGGPLDESFGHCEAMSTFDAGLAWRPDAVVIASVSSRHALELAACLQHRLPCLVEKPVAIARDELAFLRDGTAAAPALAVQVGCNLRQLPALQQLKALLAGGSLGRIVRAQFEVGQNLAQWRPGRDLAGSYSADAQRGGGVLFDLVHEVDMARWLLGALRVRAAVAGHLSHLPITSDDVHTALLIDSFSAPVVVALDYVSQRPVRRYALVGERGTAVFDLMARQLTIEHAAGVRVLTDRAEDFDVAHTYRAQMADWLAAVSDPTHAVLSPLADALDTTELMLAMQEAA